MIGNVSVQDRDLLGRLSNYFDTIESRLREGQGWLILNASRDRANRIAQFINVRLREHKPFISYYMLTWRDFALHAYVSQVELPANPAPVSVEIPSKEQSERRIADKVTQDMYYHMLYCDFLVLSGVAPTYPYETSYLDSVLGQRFDRQQPTIVISPLTMQGLEHNLRSISTDKDLWERFFGRIYQSSLIGL